jgi:hypothetical protein
MRLCIHVDVAILRRSLEDLLARLHFNCAARLVANFLTFVKLEVTRDAHENPANQRTGGPSCSEPFALVSLPDRTYLPLVVRGDV